MNIDTHSFNIRFCKIMKRHPELYDTDSKEYMNKDVRERAWIDVAIELNCEPKALKAKWKNFRTIFLRKLKQLHKGETERQYYLFPYIKFLIPYLKTKHGPEVLGSTLAEIEVIGSESDAELDNLYETESNENVGADVSQQTNDTQNPLYTDEDDEATQINPPKKLKRSISSECVVGIDNDEEENSKQMYEYETSPNNNFSAKNHTKHQSPNHNQTSTVEDNPKRHFLLSLLPDLEDMTNTQMRQFKIKVLTMIDDILKDNYIT